MAGCPGTEERAAMAERGWVVEGWREPIRPEPMVLEGIAARLEPLSEAHVPALFEANSRDDAIWDYLPYGPFATEAAYRLWVIGVMARPDPLFFALIDRRLGRPVGVVSFLRITPEAGSIEVGHICLSPLGQRTTAASEMIYLLADWAFALGYRRFEWKCNALNLPSRRAAQRFGFSYEGIFRQAAVIKGRNRDTAWFAMVDRDWPALRAAWRTWLSPDNFDRGHQVARLGDLTAPCRVASDPGL